jgi:hypothetical protein
VKLSRLAAAGSVAGPVLFTAAWVVGSLRLAALGAAGRPRRAFRREYGGLGRIVLARCAAGITVQLGGSMLAGAADP